MGLQKDLELESGVIMGFHEIVEVHVDMKAQLSSVRVCSYKSRAAKNAGKQPIKDLIYNIPYDEFPMLLNKAYQSLRLHPEFLNATEPV